MGIRHLSISEYKEIKSNAMSKFATLPLYTLIQWDRYRTYLNPHAKWYGEDDPKDESYLKRRRAINERIKNNITTGITDDSCSE